jgi:hypothetical protein
MTPEPPDPNELREWLQVCGTLAAVIVALAIAFYGRFREWRLRPRLSLAFDQDPSSMALDAVTVGSPAGSHWARVRIENARRRRSAEDVEVLVTRFRLIGASWVQPPLDTRPLRWSNSIDPVSGGPMTKVTIPPGVTRHCDLLPLEPPLWVRDRDREGWDPLPAETEQQIERGEIGASAALQIEPQPVDRRHWVNGGSYELELAVCARDVDASFYTSTIEFDGKWRQGPEIWHTLRINRFRHHRARAQRTSSTA